MNRVDRVKMTFSLLAACLTLAPHALGAQADSTPLRLTLNLPAYRLEAWAGDSLAAGYPVAIGAKPYRTPLGRFTVTDITWNPWWYPPPADWARNDTITPPCATNPMGVVKLAFGNGYFIHGTPAPSSIGNAASHGCVRIANSSAQTLAELIVAYVEPEHLPAVRGWATATTTRTLRLRSAVPLEIRYQLAEVRGDSLYLYPDVYRRVPRTAAREMLALRVLVADGLPADVIDRTALREAIARSRHAPVAVALTDLAYTTLTATGDRP